MTYKEALNKYVLAWYEVMLAVKEEGVSEEQFQSDAFHGFIMLQIEKVANNDN